MLCRDAKFLLPDLHLGGLGAEERAALEEHLAACPACGEASEEIAASAAALRRDAEADLAWAAPPTDLSTVLPAPGLRRRLGRAIRPLARAAALLLAALGAASLFGMEVRARDGALSLSFSLPGAARRAEPSPHVLDLGAPVAEAVREQVAAALVPAFHDLVLWISTAEEARRRDLSAVAGWVEERRLRDAALLADAIDATRVDLDLTRSAVFEVAGRTLPRREW